MRRCAVEARDRHANGSECGRPVRRGREFNDVVVRAACKGLRLGHPLLLGTQHDERRERGGLLPSIVTHEVQAVGIGHDKILKDDSRFELNRGGERLRTLLAEVECDVRLCRQDAADRFADYHLIVDQQDDRAIGDRYG